MRHLLLIAVLGATACRAEPPVAPHAEATRTVAGHRLTGRVIDQADVLAPAEEARIAALSAAIEARTSDQLVVVTVPSLGTESLEHLGWALGGGWGLGRKGLDNGVLMLVAPGEKKVRIAVGKGLEGLLTDARSADVVRAMIPPFAADHPGAAILIGEQRIDAILRSDLRRPQRLGA